MLRIMFEFSKLLVPTFHRSSSRAMRLILLSFALSLFASARVTALEIVPIGPLLHSLGPIPSVSTHGESVVGRNGGEATLSDGHAAIWSGEGGLLNLGALPGHDRSQATGVSADGSVVVGFSGGLGNADAMAFRWTQQSGMMGVVGFGSGVAVSRNGSTLVGSTPGSETEAALWREQSGIVRLGVPVGADESHAQYASADGSAVAIRAWENDPGNPSGTAIRTSAALWTKTEGFHDLGALPEGWQSTHPWGISDDGNALLGNGGPGNGITIPFLWSRSTGMMPLPTLDGIGDYREVFPLMMTGNASIVLGNYLGGDTPSLPFVWDAQHGVRELGQVLIDDHGLDDVFFDNVRAISPDGTALVVRKGGASAREMWILFLDKPLVTPIPEPASWLITLVGLIVVTARRQQSSA